MSRDQSLEFLNKFVELFEEMLCHDGYGDIGVQVRLGSGNLRRVTLHSGKEYEFTARTRAAEEAHKERRGKRFRIVENRASFGEKDSPAGRPAYQRR